MVNLGAFPLKPSDAQSLASVLSSGRARRGVDDDGGPRRPIDAAARLEASGRPGRSVTRADCSPVSGAGPPALLGAMPAPDVAIVGLALADGDATELIAEFAARPGSTVALVATVIGDEGYVLRAFEAGARGCLLKDSTTQELAHAIRLVHEGDAALSSRVAGRLLERFAALRSVDRLRAAALRDAPDRLSLREAEVLTDRMSPLRPRSGFARLPASRHCGMARWPAAS
jgi:DNA-binding NarL/FixJ family response regulator